jgi:biotin synthase
MGFPSLEERAGWIGLSDAEAVRALHARAYAEKTAVIGRRVSMRGLIEAGNVCAKDCRYCGIRASNRNVTRYQLTQEEIVAGARFAAESGYGSVVIQSGEIEG